MIEETPYINEDQSLFPFMAEVPKRQFKLKVGIIGATGIVGRTLLKLLKERNFPIDELHAYASRRSEGQWIETLFGTVGVEQLKPQKVPELDFVFIAAERNVAKKWGFRFARRGAIVIDKSSYFRDKPYAPLVVPEVNPKALSRHRGIISSPNCTTIPVVSALMPLHKRFILRRFTAVSFQSVSGSGKEGISALIRESNDPNAKPSAFKHRIAENVIPWIGDPGVGIAGEERKMIAETRKIMELPRLSIRSTAVRVPTLISHAIAIHADFGKKTSVPEAKDILENTPGIIVIDDPKKSEYPTPLIAAERDEVFVGRLRVDKGRMGLALWVAADNLRKGAAANAIQIAETVLNDFTTDAVSNGSLSIQG